MTKQSSFYEVIGLPRAYALAMTNKKQGICELSCNEIQPQPT